MGNGKHIRGESKAAGWAIAVEVVGFEDDKHAPVGGRGEATKGEKEGE